MTIRLRIADQPIADCGLRIADSMEPAPSREASSTRNIVSTSRDSDSKSAIRNPHSAMGKSAIRNRLIRNRCRLITTVLLLPQHHLLTLELLSDIRRVDLIAGDVEHLRRLTADTRRPFVGKLNGAGASVVSEPN